MNRNDLKLLEDEDGTMSYPIKGKRFKSHPIKSDMVSTKDRETYKPWQKSNKYKDTYHVALQEET